MNDYSGWRESLSTWLGGLARDLGDFLPDLLGAVVVLLAGWIIARILRAVAVRAARYADHLLARLSSTVYKTADRPPHVSAELLGGVVFWIVILLFLTAATQVLGLAAFTEGLQRVFAYLPTLVAGGLIIMAGFLVSILGRDLVVAAAPASFHERALLGRAVQVAILGTTVVIGADQIGIDVTFVIVLATVLIGSIAGAVAIAVSLGARTYVSNLIAAQYLRQVYRVGEYVRMGGHEGRILDWTLTTVILETDEGRVTVPAKVYQEEPVVLRMNRDEDAQ